VLSRGPAVVVATLFAAACQTGSEPPRSAGYQQGQPGNAPYAAQQQQQHSPAPAQQPAPAPPGSRGAPSGVPPLGAILGDPTQLQTIIAGALAGGAATLGALTGGEIAPLEAGIRMKAETDAKGMKPHGELMSARLTTDAHAQATLSLEPGRCYTIVGFGGPGVFAYQINLITAPPLAPQVLAQSAADAPHPSVGANTQCIQHRYPLPMQVQVDMHVIKGQGMVGARAYRK
jgi:hypothetical protein